MIDPSLQFNGLTVSSPRRPNRPERSRDRAEAADLLRIGEERLARDLSIALSTSRATPRLREAIAEFVRAAKDGGFSWQDTAAAVNALMRQAATRQVVAADIDALAQHILGWAEEEYVQRAEPDLAARDICEMLTPDQLAVLPRRELLVPQAFRR